MGKIVGEVSQTPARHPEGGAPAGHQEIEERLDGQLRFRRIFGNGLDEIVRIESDTNLTGTLDEVLLPLFDQTGNLIALLDEAGKPIARYRYSPYGDEVLGEFDLQSPKPRQLVIRAGQMWLEFTEGVSREAIQAAFDAGRVTLTETNKAQPAGAIALTLTQPYPDGPQAGQRVLLTPTKPPAPGTELQLAVAASAISDLFLNQAEVDLSYIFTWPAAGATEVVFDDSPPEIERVVVRDSKLEIAFSEEVNLAAATTALQLDGLPLTWEVGDTPYLLRTTLPIIPGSYDLTATTGLTDLAGQGLASNFTASFTFVPDEANTEVFAAPDTAQLSSQSTTLGLVTGVLASFHGRPVDLATGFYYFRHRYLDPEISRFASADPLGFRDGPSQYIFAGYDPVNKSDPLGLACPECNWSPSTVRELSQITPQEERQGYSQIVGMVPGIGDLKDVQEVLTGYDYIAKEKIGWFGRGVTVAAAALPILSGRWVRDIFKRGADVVPVDRMAKGARRADVTAVDKAARAGGVTRGKADIIDEIGGSTQQADRLIEAVNGKRVKVNILGDELFDKAYRSKGGVRSGQAFQFKDQIYLRSSSADIYTDFIHEGTHALDHISGRKRLSYHSREIRAYYYERQFQMTTGRELEHSTLQDMMLFINWMYR